MTRFRFGVRYTKTTQPLASSNVQSEGLLEEMLRDRARDQVSKEMQRFYALRRHGGFRGATKISSTIPNCIQTSIDQQIPKS